LSLLLNLQSNDRDILILFLKFITQVCSLHKWRKNTQNGRMAKSLSMECEFL
jgi:hypothetical protein